MPEGKIEIDRERCKGCELCLAFCPKGLLAGDGPINAGGYRSVRFSPGRGQEACDACARCARMCPDAAIEVLCA